MPATGRRESDEGYPPLAFDELMAIDRVVKCCDEWLQSTVHCWSDKAAVKVAKAALARIKFITPEDKA